jgi:hypothetical protein
MQEEKEDMKHGAQKKCGAQTKLGLCDRVGIFGKDKSKVSSVISH